MQKLFLSIILLLVIIACGESESSIKADYNTVSVKHLILKDDDGKKYEVKVETDNSGNKTMVLKEVKE